MSVVYREVIIIESKVLVTLGFIWGNTVNREVVDDHRQMVLLWVMETFFFIASR